MQPHWYYCTELFENTVLSYPSTNTHSIAMDSLRLSSRTQEARGRRLYSLKASMQLRGLMSKAIRKFTSITDHQREQ